jgi:hypothetical protein
LRTQAEAESGRASRKCGGILLSRLAFARPCPAAASFFPSPHTGIVRLHCKGHVGAKNSEGHPGKSQRYQAKVLSLYIPEITAKDSIKVAIDRLEYRLQEAGFEAAACRTAIETLLGERPVSSQNRSRMSAPTLPVGLTLQSGNGKRFGLK